MIRKLLLIAAVGLTLAACSSTSSSDSASTTTKAAGAGGSSTTAAGGSKPTTTTKADNSAADDEKAVQAAVSAFDERLQRQGFTLNDPPAEPSGGSSSDSGPTFTSPECKVFNDAFPDSDGKLPGQTANVDSNGLEKGQPGALDAVSVELSAATVGSPDDLDKVFGLYSDPKLVTCLKQTIVSGAGGNGATFTDVEAKQVDIGAGDDGAGIEVSAVIGNGSAKVPFKITTGFAREDRAATLMMVTSLGGGDPGVDLSEEMQTVLDDVNGA